MTTETPAPASRAALSDRERRRSKLPGRSSSGSMMTGTLAFASSSRMSQASLAPSEDELELELVGEPERGLDVARPVGRHDERLLAAQDGLQRFEVDAPQTQRPGGVGVVLRPVSAVEARVVEGLRAGSSRGRLACPPPRPRPRRRARTARASGARRPRPAYRRRGPRRRSARRARPRAARRPRT